MSLVVSLVCWDGLHPVAHFSRVVMQALLGGSVCCSFGMTGELLSLLAVSDCGRTTWWVLSFVSDGVLRSALCPFRREPDRRMVLWLCSLRSPS